MKYKFKYKFNEFGLSKFKDPTWSWGRLYQSGHLNDQVFYTNGEKEDDELLFTLTPEQKSIFLRYGFDEDFYRFSVPKSWVTLCTTKEEKLLLLKETDY